MNFYINRTHDGVTEYPMHEHNYHEIMLYISGEGYLITPDKNYPFSPGSIIIVPKGIKHGSCAEHGFKNISIGGSIEHLLFTERVTVLHDNTEKEATHLAEIIYNNRLGNKELLSDLCSAYVRLLSLSIKSETQAATAVSRIIAQIGKNFYDPETDINLLLIQSGYAQDYIRALFKKETGKTPTAFITEMRIEHACFLMDIYSDSISLYEIAEKCGFTDYAYFSRRFKSVIGISPSDYKKSAHKQ